jgi:hypothetical protein
VQEATATLFDLKYRKNYKVVQYTSTPETETSPLATVTYILYQCGGKEPDDAYLQELSASNGTIVNFVEIPLTAAATQDSTVGWMLVRITPVLHYLACTVE